MKTLAIIAALPVLWIAYGWAKMAWLGFFSRRCTILIVSSKFYWIRDLAEALSEHDVQGCFRTYRVRDFLRGEPAPDFVVSSGTCKGKNEYGESYGVYYSARPEAVAAGVPVVPYWPFRLWVAITLWRRRKLAASVA